jgi:aminoglycoside 3-N-acetyltransferase
MPTPLEHPDHFVPNTVESLVRDLRAVGVREGQTIIVHTSLSRLGWTVGGAEAVIRALMDVVTPAGTLVMPAQTADNSEPSHWVNPPVPDSWWPVIRAHLPPYDPQTTPTGSLGVVAECFRTFPNVMRSHHPMISFTAWGANAQPLISHQSLEAPIGDDSPIARLLDLDGRVLLLGVNHGVNTSLHLAEHRARIPHPVEKQGSAMWVNGRRRWVEYDLFAYDDSGFAELGADYEAAIGYTPAHIGLGEARLHRLGPLLAFAVGWLEAKRGGNA